MEENCMPECEEVDANAPWDWAALARNPTLDWNILIGTTQSWMNLVDVAAINWDIVGVVDDNSADE